MAIVHEDPGVGWQNARLIEGRTAAILNEPLGTSISMKISYGATASFLDSNAGFIGMHNRRSEQMLADRLLVRRKTLMHRFQEFGGIFVSVNPNRLDTVYGYSARYRFSKTFSVYMTKSFSTLTL